MSRDYENDIKGFIYLLQPSKYKHFSYPPIVKIGVSNRYNFNQLQSFGFGTRVLGAVHIKTNIYKAERELKEVFSDNFSMYQDDEYFAGDLIDMVNEFFDFCKMKITEEDALDPEYELFFNKVEEKQREQDNISHLQKWNEKKASGEKYMCTYCLDLGFTKIGKACYECFTYKRKHENQTFM